jgi:hypothetical protein
MAYSETKLDRNSVLIAAWKRGLEISFRKSKDAGGVVNLMLNLPVPEDDIVLYLQCVQPPWSEYVPLVRSDNRRIDNEMEC